MKDVQNLTKLLKVTQLQYDQQRRLFAKVVQEENTLRQELSRLADLSVESQTGSSRLATMRAIGADLLWQGWLARSKANLNMSLARVLAIKEHEQVKAHRAFGKLTALERLIARTEQQNRRQMTKTRLVRTMNMIMMHNR